MSESSRPPHHGPDGRFRIPWPLEIADQRGRGGILRWQLERLTQKRAPNPRPEQVPVVPHSIAYPRAAEDEIRITWIGHASFLVQAAGLNLLTDPHWSRRASPSQRIGPARFQEPGVPWDALPPIDAVLLSHDHYDHLDEGTVKRLHARFGSGLRWITPLAYREWFSGVGVENVTELDWWDEAEVGGIRIACAPAQHWTRRKLREMNDRLWASYALLLPDGRRIYFGGDSGYFRGYEEIGRRLGPFDVCMLPIGAYDPRWFMAPAHMNPEEAVRAYRDLGGRGAFLAMHWGTFRLTDEDPLEPPVRARAAWQSENLPADDFHILRHGETLLVSEE
ncbi:MAG TPA: MBL fold metallo-hydrolase [Longimicrobium sp.]|nr:MBL fold metallo-hydrolase [Longimicrobium sp.]